MHQHEMRVWHFVGRVRRKTSPTGSGRKFGLKKSLDKLVSTSFLHQLLLTKGCLMPLGGECMRLCIPER